MSDSLLDDVKALLDQGFDDDRILKQICRACENNEIISNYERNYVEKLAEKYLGRKPKGGSIPAEVQPIVPDVVIPQTSAQKIQTLHQITSRPRPSKLKNPKIILGIVLVAIIVSIVGFVSSSDLSSPTPAVISDTLYVQIDSSSYQHKDLISINGESNISGTVNLSITNQSNQLVWTEQVYVKNNGSYSTLAIAGGPNWNTSGNYTITVDDGTETRSTTFSFTG